MMEKSDAQHLNGSLPQTISAEASRDVEEGRPALASSGEVLNPQPSDDPADPLNWPLGLKVSRRQPCHVSDDG